ncbi:MAG: phage tail tape measure protein, partial [Pyrinomonadaceae bacterium]
MSSSASYELAILLSLRDAASGRLDRFGDKLRATGKEGRAAAQQIEDLRQSIGRDLTLGGVGVASLAMLRNGVREAGNFESAITDLRVSVTELNRDGSVSLGQLSDQMNRFEQLGVRLGNSLPGNTQDFLEMFATLKQGGLETESILRGAGEAVAFLAVASKQLPRDLAVPFAEFGQQFNLKGQDYVRLADLFARARPATGATPEQMVEASKYFQLRAGTSLGMTGIEGAEATTRLLAMLGRKGLKGSEAGTGLSAVFSRMTFSTDEQQKVLKELGKQGI